MKSSGPRRLLAALLLAAALPAQERRPLIGRVVDTDGKPAASAVVTLFHTPAGDPTGATTDRVDVRTDERGRFVAQLLHHCGYSAFALGPEGKGRMVSGVRDLVAAGGDLELQLAMPATPRPIALAAADEWRDQDPLRLCVLPAAPNRLRVDVALVDGKGTIPPLPAPLTFVVFDQGGEVLWLQIEQREQLLDAVNVPPPHSLQVLVRDVDGVPIGGASIHWQAGMLAGPPGLLQPMRMPALRRVGTTAADGSAVVRFPMPVTGKHRQQEFTALAPGRAAHHVPWREASERTLYFALGRGLRLRLVTDGSPLARHGASSMTTDGVARACTDDEGWLELREGAGEFTVMADPIALDGMRTTAVATVPHLRGGETVDLARLRRVRVQVLRPDGGPARGLPVFLLHHGKWVFRVDPVYTDAAGRVELRLGAEDWLLFVFDGEQTAWRSVLADDRATDCALQMAPLPRLRCRVVDQAGKVVAGAKVLTEEAWSAANLLGEEAVLSMLGNFLTLSLRSSRHSDGAGLLELPFLPRAAASCQVTIGRDGVRSEPIAVRATADVIDVVVR